MRVIWEQLVTISVSTTLAARMLAPFAKTNMDFFVIGLPDESLAGECLRSAFSLMSAYCPRKLLGALRKLSKRESKTRLGVSAFLRKRHGLMGLSQRASPFLRRDSFREELLERRTAKTERQQPSKSSDAFLHISRSDGFTV